MPFGEDFQLLFFCCKFSRMQITSIFRFTIIFLTVSFLLYFATECGSDCFYQKTIEVPNSQWTYGDSIRFEFDIPDTSARYNLNLEVEHASDFAFQNLYVKFHTRYPSGKEVAQVVSLELAKKAVIWQGECSGHWCHLTIPLQTSAIFPEPGKQSLVLEQFMRENPLKGIRSFSLCIQKEGDGK